MNNIIKKSLIGGAMILGGLSVAQAATVTPGVGTYTFSGPATLSAFGINPMCTLSLTGDVQKDGNGGVTVTVTDGDATGGFACGFVGFEFPWTANVPADKIPADPTQDVAIMFDNVVVTAIGSNCTDGPVSIPAIFSNGDPISEPSSFSFNANVGSCAVNGTVSAQSDVNVTQ